MSLKWLLGLVTVVSLYLGCVCYFEFPGWASVLLALPLLESWRQDGFAELARQTAIMGMAFVCVGVLVLFL